MQQHTFEPAAMRRLSSLDEVEAVVGRPAAVVMKKQISVLDAGCRSVLAHSPVAAFGYRGADGTVRTTFVGGTPGFARVHSSQRFSFSAPGAGVASGPASLFFLLPGVGEVLRVNGTASALKGGDTAVDVSEAYVHCAQAVIRAGLWEQPDQPRAAEPVPGRGPLAGPGIGDFLSASPFLALSTWDTEGGSDTSPRGERQSVARILDGRTLVLADRKGNRRADTLHNLLRDDRIALAALVPGRSGVLHIHGHAAITDDAALLKTLALRGVPPHLALLIDVEYAEIRSGDAVSRARLWSPDVRSGRDSAPDMMAVGSAHLAAGAAESGRASGWLIRLITAIPGLSRLLRKAADRAYVAGLRKEGYDDVRAPAAARRGETRHGQVAESPLRPVRICGIRQETPSARTLVLEDSDTEARPFHFHPGQFFTLVTDIAGHPVRRAYSASSAPGATRLELTVKHVEGGRFSTHAHRDLRVGDRLAVRGPSGTFHAPPQATDQLVLIAAGSGITPMMSMIRARLSAPASAGRIDLLYSSRSPEEIIFSAELARMEKDRPDRLTVTHVLTGRDGRLDAEGIRRWATGLPLTDSAHHFVCGPEALMDTAQDVLRQLGVPDEHMHQERFSGGATAPATQAPQEMRVEKNGSLVGVAVVEPGQSLLDAGLAAELPMPYSCTVGNCGECMVRVRSGEVTQPEHTCLTPQQKADGQVLACVSCPLSEVTLDIADPTPPGAH
ncbi:MULTISPECIES: 2Fe-2S iron-sulfur cluster-binding protein [Streptomyces]|uniref:2Fe-2S iron-sulfur cluster-binding protein n=1 Tax=Streptomyces TaxID=1883 RepID=UPI0016454702|nr:MULTISPECIES: 2Fe-2S iron-sulfur cluster-binding protein [Streptomyces]MBT3073798.1 2Fe-2S iron-sulfur cluster binding domain-containing protein [Streptomyces sp. COG21]MBT3083707.1 2Fe-2S iron-sulfur cluster binding domain-containing protein [Streptomyces sp. COG20]MBT3088905.1 2Fe-2S iron-sulfur cluster binding domain-containing protein [Streptomyces sp. CYG21]MBT3097548.1 2Fe-2S iron-sulfur cluster binding domain-containing protein [Streptomyces sp. CBG30]MBT3109536.1 2Fe-2S iron-sulfur 